MGTLAFLFFKQKKSSTLKPEMQAELYLILVCNGRVLKHELLANI